MRRWILGTLAATAFLLAVSPFDSALAQAQAQAQNLARTFGDAAVRATIDARTRAIYGPAASATTETAVSALYGVVENERANRGLFVTT